MTHPTNFTHSNNSARPPFSIFVLLFFLFLFLSAFCLPAPAHASCPNADGLVGWWKFDETSGTTAADSSGNDNPGTATGTTIVAGKINDARSFNGSSDYVDVGASDGLNITGPKTITAWIKLSALNSLQAIFSRYLLNSPYTGYSVAISSGNVPIVMIDGTWTAAAGPTLTSGVWYHVAFVFDGSSNVSYYVDGALADTQSAGNNPSVAATAIIGSDPGPPNDPFHGTIDDVRIYNRALSVGQIQQIYNNTLPDLVGNEADLMFNADERVMQYCDGHNWIAMGQPLAPMNGLVGWWKFDDGTGTSAVDSSGNSNTGTLNGSPLPTWTAGMDDGAITFNADNSTYVATATTPAIGTGAATFSAWVYDTDTYNTNLGVMGISGQIALVTDHDNAWFFTDDNATHMPESAGGSVVLNQWQMITVVRDSSANVTFYVNGVQSGTANQYAGPITAPTGPLTIGTGQGYGWYGLIDDARVYNRALSATEISNLYYATGGTATGDISTGLVGWWKLDDGSGTTAADSSGNGNNGTTQNSPTWTTAGKINSALSFDGTSQYVSSANSSSLEIYNSPITVAFWMKMNNTATSQIAVLKPYEYTVCVGGGNISLHDTYGNGLGTSVSLSSGTWYHVAMVFDGTSTIYTYFNGSLVGTPGISGTWSATADTSNLTIAKGDGILGCSANYFDGTLDDVRIYNRALSAADVAALYNERACTGPSGWAGDIKYNTDYHVAQFCDGKNWQAMGPVPGAGGAACNTPSGAEGDLIYNKDKHVMQYCDGTNWVAIGGLPKAPEGGLVGWWKFDEGSGTTAADSSGNNNTGTLVNSPTWTTGMDAGALAFNGTNQYVDTNNSILSGATAFSAFAWAKTSTTADDGARVVSKGDFSGANGGGFLLRARGGQTGEVYDFDLGIDCSVGDGGAIPYDTAWHQVGIVYTGSVLEFFFDGVLKNSASCSGPTIHGTNNLQISGYNNASAEVFNGTIDDVRIYNRVLSASQVWDLYLATGGT